MTTKQKGDIAVAALITALLKIGCSVLLPFGDRDRYDLVIDNNGKFSRVQIKAGRLKGNTVKFSTHSVTTKNGKIVHASYQGQVEYFGVYCHEVNACYLVPIEVCGVSMTSLRLAPSKNKQKKGVNNAQDFILL